jgi:hypothetical protein
MRFIIDQMGDQRSLSMEESVKQMEIIKRLVKKEKMNKSRDGFIGKIL